MRSRSTVAGWGCAIAVLLCIVAINPRAEIGMNDDWSYIFTAKRLAETGHIFYNGWATATIGVQLYLGALFIRIFGFSFTVVRVSSMMLAVLSAPLIHATFMRCGVRSWNAILGTLTLVLSPLYLPLATGFMSDSFAMFFMTAFFYACVRSLSAQDTRSVLGWLLTATISGLAGGSVRQIAALTVLVALPCMVWQMKTNRRIFAAGVMLWIVSFASVLFMIHWFHQQPYISVEQLYHIPNSSREFQNLVVRMQRSLGSCVLLMIPILLGVALKFPVQQAKRRKQLWLALATVLLVVTLTAWRNGPAWWGTWLIGDYVTTAGILWQPNILGPRPQVIAPAIQAVGMFCLIAVPSVSAAVYWRTRREALSRPKSKAGKETFWLAVPFTIAYLALIATRTTTYDRYYLPLLFLAVLLLLQWYQSHFTENLSLWTMVPLGALAFFAVAGTHDLFAASRARLRAANELVAAGVARTEFRAGFEYDGWTQIEQSGFVNEPRLRPTTAYHRIPPPDGLMQLRPSPFYDGWQKLPGSIHPCITWFHFYTPSIHAHYILETAPGYCFPESGFQPVHYRTWLAPHDRALYVGEIPPEYR